MVGGGPADDAAGGNVDHGCVELALACVDVGDGPAPVGAVGSRFGAEVAPDEVGLGRGPAGRGRWCGWASAMPARGASRRGGPHKAGLRGPTGAVSTA